jgi:glyoxylase-like metal-dependent hydrolase (beta-lactamase superfamily II)
MIKAGRWILAAALAAMIANGCSRRADISGTGLIRLDDGVYAYIAAGPSSAEGLGANSGFVVGEEAVLVIDSRFTVNHARQLLDAVRSVTDVPIRYLVNTHYHPDHVWGNSIFRAEGAIILARPETSVEMERFSPLYKDYYRDRKPDVYGMIRDVETALPDSFVQDGLTIDLGGIEAVLAYYGPGHTAGDLVVSVPSRRIVFTGGLVSNGYHPNLGDQGADLGNWLRTLDLLAGGDPAIVVPGQGPAGDTGMIDLTKNYIVDLTGLAIDAIRKGMPLSRSIQEIKAPGAEGFLQANILPFNIQALYRHKVLEVVAPGVEMDMPTGFAVSDGGGGTDAGMVKWLVQSEEGYVELELSWQPTSMSEVLLEDIHGRISRYASSKDDIYDLNIESSRKVLVGDDVVPAAAGSWKYRKGMGMKGGGAWLWTMTIMDGRLYSIRMLTNTGYDEVLEGQNMAMLEQVISTFRRKESGL